MTFATNPTAMRTLRRAAMSAALAPSVHNTQPWHFILRENVLELRADLDRRLAVLDPRGRQLTISCGCALFNARVQLAADGYDAIVDRFPDPAQPDLLARLTLPSRTQEWLPIGDLAPAIDLRRTNRRHFADEHVTPDVVHDLVVAAQAEGAELLPIVDSGHRDAVAKLSRQADRIENADPAYRAELIAWTTDDPRREDGVPAAAVPYRDALAGSRDELPIRGFDTRGMGWLPAYESSDSHDCLFLLGTLHDSPEAWLRAGEALEHVWLELTSRSYMASPLTQVVEVASTHHQLRAQLSLVMHPVVLLRVGRAADTVQTRRRRPADVISEPH